jgi:pyruvate/2-oxoglutarate dehydrogenase complex dihydrolipoamide dehydrogenase (E3) component
MPAEQKHDLIREDGFTGETRRGIRARNGFAPNQHGGRSAPQARDGGGTRRIYGNRVFLNLGSRERMLDVLGLAETHPMTHVEALDLDRLPEHLIVIEGGYSGLELSQAFRLFGSRVVLIEEGAQLASREDPDIGAALLDLFYDEGIETLLET